MTGIALTRQLELYLQARQGAPVNRQEDNYGILGNMIISNGQFL
jgi:hypothetical protein